jgi:hypothetical protein
MYLYMQKTAIAAAATDPKPPIAHPKYLIKAMSSNVPTQNMVTTQNNGRYGVFCFALVMLTVLYASSLHATTAQTILNTIV